MNSLDGEDDEVVVAGYVTQPGTSPAPAPRRLKRKAPDDDVGEDAEPEPSKPQDEAGNPAAPAVAPPPPRKWRTMDELKTLDEHIFPRQPPRGHDPSTRRGWNGPGHDAPFSRGQDDLVREAPHPSRRSQSVQRDGTLSTDDIAFDLNPHLWQLRLQNVPSVQTFAVDDCGRTWHRVLLDSAQRVPYQRIPYDMRSVNHWGQRKLLLSEVEFLTEYYRPGRLVVYAGAAPGTHTSYLSQLFPELDFLLVDPSPFCDELQPDKRAKRNMIGRIEIRQEFFLDDTVDELLRRKEETGVEILFISDIRTADPKSMGEEEVEACVQRDMEMQMRWAVNLRPVASMHKFRLPWGDGASEYLEGRIFLPVWGPQTTTETRLVVDDHTRIKTYDNRKYEEQMAYFNRFTRVQYYVHDVRAPGLDACFDCASEIAILKEYLAKFPRSSYGGRVESQIGDMSMELSRMCSRGRTLATQVSVFQRKSWFEGKRFDPVQRRIFSSENRPLHERVRPNMPIQRAPRSLHGQNAMRPLPNGPSKEQGPPPRSLPYGAHGEADLALKRETPPPVLQYDL